MLKDEEDHKKPPEKPLAADAEVDISEELQRMKSSRTISFEMLSNKVEPFTMKLADKFLNLPTFIGERTLRDRHVEFLIKEAKRGAFLAELASLIWCECPWDKVAPERRVNGQHCCWLRSYMDDGWNPQIRVIKYRVETEEDFRKLYAAIDRGAPRTKAHVITSRLFGTNEYDGVSQSSIKLLESGYSVYKGYRGGGTSATAVSPDEIADELMSGSYTLAIRVAKFIDGMDSYKDFRHMWRASVVGAMFGTFNRAIKESEEFWNTVKTGVGIDNVNDPRLRLRNYLQRSNVDIGHGSKGDMQKVSAEEMYRVCVHMWNAHRDDELVKVIKMPSKRPTAK